MAKLGTKLSDEHRAKLRKAWERRRLTPVSEETRAKISQAGFGKTHSKQWNQRIGAGNRGYVRTAKQRADLSAAHNTPEYKEKFRNARLGHPVSIETREILSRKCRSASPYKRVWSNTKPERAVHEWLRSCHINFETQFYISVHPYDIVIPKLKILIEVDGCYWHRCPVHHPNSQFYKDTSIFDRRAKTEGWAVLHLWEHDIPLLQQVWPTNPTGS